MDALERTLQPTRRTLGEVDPVQPLDTTHPLLDVLEGFWLPLPRLTGGSRLYDLSAQKRHGTLRNMNAANDWTYDSGLPYAALDFDGSDDSVLIGDGSNWLTSNTASGTEATAWAYVKMPTNPTGNHGIVGALELSSASWILLADDSDFNTGNTNCFAARVGYEGQSGTKAGTATLDGSVTPGEWQFLTLVFTNDDLLIYLDGELNNKASQGNGILNSEYDGLRATSTMGDAQIGNSGDFAGSFPGRISVVGGAKRAMSAQEVHDLYKQARRGFPDLLNRRDSVGLLGGGGGASPISGTFALTDSQETVSATGQTEVSGILSVTDGSETLTINGATKVSGTASITEAVEQISGAGSVITTGSVSITDGGEIISAVSSLQDITGTAQITDAGEEVSATGEVKIAGTASLADGTEEVVIIGENDITGSLSFADLAAEIAATGSVEVQGSLALTDAGETITARERVPARLATVDVRLEDIIIVNAKLTD